ncbi:BCCT family transporter [Streptomyces sp. NPDC059101]|uniref:BCCT family transporter n=1 Tax=Streptomyces sp. NPDC059101 TaxID=3346728 RepID=UPI0036740165
MSWALFVGTVLARVSHGRAIREFLVGGLVGWSTGRWGRMRELLSTAREGEGQARPTRGEASRAWEARRVGWVESPACLPALRFRTTSGGTVGVRQVSDPTDRSDHCADPGGVGTGMWA